MSFSLKKLFIFSFSILILIFLISYIRPAPVFAEDCSPGQQGEVCTTGTNASGEPCAQGHKYCVWNSDGNYWGDCSEEVNTCGSNAVVPTVEDGVCANHGGTNGLTYQDECEANILYSLVGCADGSTYRQSKNQSCHTVGPCNGRGAKTHEYCMDGKITESYECSDGTPDYVYTDRSCERSDGTSCGSHGNVVSQNTYCQNNMLRSYVKCSDGYRSDTSTGNKCDSRDISPTPTISQTSSQHGGDRTAESRLSASINGRQSLISERGRKLSYTATANSSGSDLSKGFIFVTRLNDNISKESLPVVNSSTCGPDGSSCATLPSSCVSAPACGNDVFNVSGTLPCQVKYWCKTASKNLSGGTGSLSAEFNTDDSGTFLAVANIMASSSMCSGNPFTSYDPTTGYFGWKFCGSSSYIMTGSANMPPPPPYVPPTRMPPPPPPADGGGTAPTVNPSPTVAPSRSPIVGDVDGNGCVNDADLYKWKYDFVNDRVASLLQFNDWFRAMRAGQNICASRPMPTS